MDTVYQQYKKCGVKVKIDVGGSERWSSGFLYATSPKSQYNYVITAKHTFKHSSDDNEVYIEDIDFVEIQCYKQTEFTHYDYIPKKEVADKIILFESDLVIILVRKNSNFEIPYIQVSDIVSGNCKAWAITNANNNRLFPLDFKVSDSEEKLYTIEKWDNSKQLHGCSGSGIISEDRPILNGFIMKYPTEEFQGGFIDAVDISFEQINNKLYNQKLEVLSTIDNKKKRIVGNQLVVDINDVTINGVKLDLQLARNRVISDTYDDWFHDPLNFIDLSHEDFLFEYFRDSFNKEYKVSEAEVFYLPKKSFTLRKAMVIPYADRIFYSALIEVIGKRMDNALSPYVFSARYNKQKHNGLIISGVEQWKKMQYLLKDYSLKYKYVIEIDILNFYDNIDIELLGKKISAVCQTHNERKASKELVKVLKKFADNKSNGIPQNNDVSSLLATFYLNQVDAYMRHHVPAYVRFMDDIRIFCNDKFEARRYLTLIEKELRRLNLSLNGQKTKIINLNPRLKKEKEAIADSYRKAFDLDKSKLSRFSKSRNVSIINEAFHLAIKVLLENVKENPTGSNSNERKLNQAITTIRRCVSKGVNLEKENNITQFIEEAGILMKERPWITPQVCTMIGVLDKKYISRKFWSEAIEIVLDAKFNIYPWQGYHLWLLLAKHKIDDVNLRKYASNYLDSNDETSRPIIAAMMIYMGTIDSDYRRVILRKYNEGFTHGNFQDRIALIVLRAIDSSEVSFNNDKIKAIHESLNYFKDKDLVYIPGEKDDIDIDLELLQIYSL
ncbi:RNA-directed DNA polymerase [Saccharicrinis fermentans]|uniref:RNA-directed DNA polymerase n=1 Tax=Saccharicrinis fermentans TaxID=982 RepID=UPI000482DB4E|nr:RNA-directed DNA polymerase [Saccharicrinis fermentans]